jgi:hypothetical protein
MALFVFGAGATRGASFVDSTRDPCLPPLDPDFFTQLQRIRNPKHASLVKAVMRDVVELFGPNFSATVETVFTTLEHTIRMLQTTGDNRAFKRASLSKKRDRLVQAIAAVLEESLTESDEQCHSTHERKTCDHHDRFVTDLVRAKDKIISFNYDCVLDDSLYRCGSGKWNPRYGYGFNLGARGAHLTGDQHWCPDSPAPARQTAHLYKLHGSLHFQAGLGETASRINLKQHPYTKRRGDLRFTIIPPEWHKAYNQGLFAKLWKDAASAIRANAHIVFIGYSLPPADLHSTALFRTAIKGGGLNSLTVVNPDQEARRRIRTVVQRGLTPSSRVHSIDKFVDFVAMDRSTWDV